MSDKARSEVLALARIANSKGPNLGRQLKIALRRDIIRFRLAGYIQGSAARIAAFGIEVRI